MKASFRLILAALVTTVTLTGCVQEITLPNFEKDKVLKLLSKKWEI